MVTGYSINDWFFAKSDVCSSSPESAECEANRQAASRYVKASSKMDVTDTQYRDLLALYNRELLFTINMVVGLIIMCYYIYLNQSAIGQVASTVIGTNVGPSPIAPK